MAPKRSGSVSNPWEAEHHGKRRRLDSGHSYDQVRQAPRQGRDRPGGRGCPGGAGRRRGHHEGHGCHRRGQPHGREWRRAGPAEATRPNRDPRVQRGQRLRHRRHGASGGHHGHQGRGNRHGTGLRSREAVRCRATGRRLSPRGQRNVDTRRVARAQSPPLDGRIGTEIMPGVFAQIGMEYGHKYGGTELRAFRQDKREEPLPLHAQPLGGVQQAHEPGGDHGRCHDRLPQHAARCARPTATGQRRRCW